MMMTPPRQLMIDKPHVFSEPLAIIFNRSFKTATWPNLWKDELTNFIEKKGQPEVLKDMRPICRSYLFAKLEEAAIRDDILADIMPNIHGAQFGGLKGRSADTMMAAMYQDVIDSAENGYMSLLVAVDFSKAFNTCSHPEICSAAARNGDLCRRSDRARGTS